MSLTISIPHESVLNPDIGYTNISTTSSQNASRAGAAAESCQFQATEASKVKGKAARIFKPTRTEYEHSFGVQLGDLHGRCRWDIAGKVAELWPGLPRIGLRDTIREALARPEEKIYKGFSIRHEAILHCYMIGYDKRCAHPTIAICHPLPVVLKRSAKLVSAMTKKVCT